MLANQLAAYVTALYAEHFVSNFLGAANGVLSDHLRHLCDQAIAHATEEGRKTVMDRDFEPFVDLP